MEVFDYITYDAVGIAERLGNSDNATIYCIGMVNRETGRFTFVAPEERKNIFSPRGRIYAHKFLEYHPGWEEECVCLCTKPNINENIKERDDFVWDWKDEPYIFAEKLKEVSEHLGENGQYNINILEKHGITNCGEKGEYFLSGGYLYYYSKDSRIMPFWKLADVSYALFWNHQTPYLWDDIRILETGSVDITSDEQLIGWYKKKILKKEWNTIYESKDFNAVNDLISSELSSINIPSNIFESRLSRIMNINHNISLTYDELQDLSESPWFGDVIANCIQEYSDKYIAKVKEDNSELIRKEKNTIAEEIKKEKDKRDSIIDGYKFDIELKKEEIDNLDKRLAKEEQEKSAEVQRLEDKIKKLNDYIADKESAIKDIEARKETILKDFAIVKDVLQSGRQEDVYHENDIVSLSKLDKHAFEDARPFRKSLETYLKYFQCHKISPDNIITQLSLKRILLLPDINTISAIMYASRHCKYTTAYVGVNWKSFSDFWDNGLGSIVQSAIDNPDIVHFLILRNINMTYIPSYLQPIIDMGDGLVVNFPGKKQSFPNNLRILCTRTKDTLIPISDTVLEDIGCIKIDEELSKDERKARKDNLTENDYITGYLSVDLLEKLPIKKEYFELNQTEYYVDEQ